MQDNRILCHIAAIAACAAMAGAGCSRNEQAAEKPQVEGKPSAVEAAKPEAPIVKTEPGKPAEKAADKPSKPALKPIGQAPVEIAADQDSADGVIAAAMKLRDLGEFSEASRTLTAALERFKGADGERIAGAINDLRALRREANELEYAIKMLSSGSYAELRVATDELSKAGDVGRIMLRRIVRSGTNELAVAQAVKILSHSASPDEAAEIMARMMANLDSPLRADFVKALAAAPKTTPAETFAGLVPFVADDKDFANSDFAGLLLDAAFDACNGDSAAFDSAVGREGMFDLLKGYAKGALESTNKVARSIVSRHAAELGVMVKGIRGSFYADQNFQNLAYERVEQQIQYNNRDFPYPDNRQDDISIRWTGKLVIKTAGSYHFHFSSDDGNRLFIDGNKVFGHWGNPADNRANVELSAGIHDIVIEFQQGQGGAHIRCNWIPPGGQEQPLTGESMICIPVY